MNCKKHPNGYKKKEVHPLMYKGFFIKRCANGNLSADNFGRDIFINALIPKWPNLKSLIDAII